jgi:hypothetical protein
MRRIAIKGFALAGCLAVGCGTSPHYRNIGTTRNEPIVDSGLTRVSGTIGEDRGAPALDDGTGPVRKRAFAKQNVPDSVMLRDQVDSGYSDGPVPR